MQASSSLWEGKHQEDVSQFGPELFARQLFIFSNVQTQDIRTLDEIPIVGRVCPVGIISQDNARRQENAHNVEQNLYDENPWMDIWVFIRIDRGNQHCRLDLGPWIRSFHGHHWVRDCRLVPRCSPERHKHQRSVWHCFSGQANHGQDTSICRTCGHSQVPIIGSSHVFCLSQTFCVRRQKGLVLWSWSNHSCTQSRQGVVVCFGFRREFGRHGLTTERSGQPCSIFVDDKNSLSQNGYGKKKNLATSKKMETLTLKCPTTALTYYSIVCSWLAMPNHSKS